MKRKRFLINTCFIFLAICTLGFATYALALNQTTVNVTGTIGFIAHNVDARLDAFIYGCASSSTDVPVTEEQKIRITPTNGFLIDNKTTSYNLDLGATNGTGSETRYFSNLGESGNMEDIIVQIRITNTSAGTSKAGDILVTADMANCVTGSEYIYISCDKTSVMLETTNGKTQSTFTFTIKLLQNSDGTYSSVELPNNISLAMVLDGDSIYTGFDGYVWQGATRTSIKAEQTGTVDESIIEDTLSITEKMATYYPGEYLDLKSNVIADMSSYFPYIGKTQYSGTTISSITVFAENAGELYIGTANVADVINAKKNSYSLIACTTTAYSVVEGRNDITLSLNIGETETLVIGGNNSVGIYCAKGIPVPETTGAYAYINGEYNANIIQMTNGYNDTLAIKIVITPFAVDSTAYIENLKTSVVGQVNGYNVIKGGAESYGMVMSEGTGAPGYQGTKITKLGFIFASKFSDCSSGSIVTTDVTDTDAWVYAYVIKNTVFTGNQRASENCEKMYKLTFANFTPNASTQNHGNLNNGNDVVTIGENPWSYTTDISVYDSVTDSYSTVSSISVGNDEMIGFAVGNCNFMLVTDYSNASYVTEKPYTEYGDQLNYWYYEDGGWKKSVQCAFPVDMYCSTGVTTFAENYARLEAEEAKAEELDKANRVKNAHTNGKTISFLGDSLTAYEGWSDNTSYNSTLGSNWNSYGPTSLPNCDIQDVNQTWWKQAADDMGMTVLVNNSCSGSKTSAAYTENGTNVPSGLDRCEQLHNTSGTNPDIIAVYMGINDMLQNVSIDTFTSTYTQMIQKIKAKYSNAEIVVFTLPYVKLMDSSTDGKFVDIDTLNSYNSAISTIGNENGCTVVEVYPNYSWTADNWTEYCITDTAGLGHPTAAGMDLVTNAFIDTFYTKYVGTN